MAFALLFDSEFADHDPGQGHPESPARVEAVAKGLHRAGLLPAQGDEVDGVEGVAVRRIDSPRATEAQLALCHPEPYQQLVAREVKEGRTQLSTGDAGISAESFEVARRAVGGCCAAVDAMLDKEDPTSTGFCAVRPPGHHASASTGMGFCLFNNIAVAARHAITEHGLERVAIFDWDVHHGNGTQDLFDADPAVFFASTHQSPWYPGTGAAGETGIGRGEGSVLNRPLPAGSGGSEIIGVLKDDILPAIDAFEPDLILISAGFDSREGDPLGHFQLTDDDFVEMTRLLRDLAIKHCEGRVLSVLEGGYSLTGLGSAVEAHAAALAEPH